VGSSQSPCTQGGLHKPSFSGKAAKNSQGRCATGCVLPVPGLFYIAAALGLGPDHVQHLTGKAGDWGDACGTPVPLTHSKSCSGMISRSEEVTRRIEVVSVSLSLVRGFAL